MTDDVLDIVEEFNLDKSLVKMNHDGSIDYYGNVDLSNMNLDTIPIKFKRVTGTFDVSFNPLSSLKNSPEYVGGNFNCRNNAVKFTEEQVRAVCQVKGYVYV